MYLVYINGVFLTHTSDAEEAIWLRSKGYTVKKA